MPCVDTERHSFGDFNAVYGRRQNTTGIACAFTGGVQALSVDALKNLYRALYR